MRTWRAGFWTALLVTLVAATPGRAQDDKDTYEVQARLAPVAIDVAMRENVTGVGMVTATLSRSTLTLKGTFEGLKSNATVAHIHQGSAPGTRGPKILDLTISKATSGDLSGSFDLTPGQVRAFKKGTWYVQIHSEKAPDGNLWGWLVK